MKNEKKQKPEEKAKGSGVIKPVPFASYFLKMVASDLIATQVVIATVARFLA